MKYIGVLALVVFLGACKSSSPTVDKAASFENYQEDLSSYLPSYPEYQQKMKETDQVDSEISAEAIDEDLAALAKEEYDKKKSDPYFNGYRVLIFSGLDREQAFKTVEDMEELFPDIQADMQYQQPRYMVKVGRFAYKVEALKYYNQLKKEFPTARIIQDRILRQEFTVPSQEIDAERQN